MALVDSHHNVAPIITFTRLYAADQQAARHAGADEISIHPSDDDILSVARG